MEETQELLELYMELAEKQEEVICCMSEVIRKQSQEIRHCRNTYRYMEINGQGMETLEKALEEYNKVKSQVDH